MLPGQVRVQESTVTVNVHEPVRLAASVATQVTVVTPGLKQVPEGGVQETLAPGQLSEAVGVV